LTNLFPETRAEVSGLRFVDHACWRGGRNITRVCWWAHTTPLDETVSAIAGESMRVFFGARIYGRRMRRCTRRQRRFALLEEAGNLSGISGLLLRRWGGLCLMGVPLVFLIKKFRPAGRGRGRVIRG